VTSTSIGSYHTWIFVTRLAQCLQRYRIVTQLCLLSVGWHARAASLPLGDVIMAKLACIPNDVIFCLHRDLVTYFSINSRLG
jgi:hypothetical protein